MIGVLVGIGVIIAVVMLLLFAAAWREDQYEMWKRSEGCEDRRDEDEK